MKKSRPGICTIEAPCKINLHLGVGERRPDGFHNLQSIVASLALADTLSFELTERAWDCSIQMNWEVPEMAIPPDKNLVFRAVSLFREKTGFTDGLKIQLDKRIPVGAGLGGGSSDAASALMALNFLAGNYGQRSARALPMRELKKMAAMLGSDVPFFLTGGTAFVSGRGELVKPVKSPRGLWVVLIKPSFSSDTASAFRLLDLAREELARHRLPEKKLSRESLVRALKDDPGTWPFYNDFLPVFFNSHLLKKDENDSSAAVYRAILENLREKGASFTGLSGAGSCCFGVFTSREAAENAEKTPGGPETCLGLTFFLAQNAKAVIEY